MEACGERSGRVEACGEHSGGGTAVGELSWVCRTDEACKGLPQAVAPAGTGEAVTAPMLVPVATLDSIVGDGAAADPRKSTDSPVPDAWEGVSVKPDC